MKPINFDSVLQNKGNFRTSFMGNPGNPTKGTQFSFIQNVIPTHQQR